MAKTPDIPNPADAAVAGITADTALQPFKYLINAAADLGEKITIGGKVYDFTGQGNAATAGKISDQMAQVLLDLQKTNSPQIIAQRLAELKAADPQGYAARQQLFDRILSDAQNHPGHPVNEELQSLLQNELAKGNGFNDAKQEEQVREGARGGQVERGIFLGNTPTTEEAAAMVRAGDQLRDERQQQALDLLQSGASPDDIAYREFQQSIANLANFQSGQTPTAQFQQVSGASNGPVQLTGQSPNPNLYFNPNAAQNGMSNALGTFGAQQNYAQSQANPWLAGLSIGGQTFSTLNRINPGWFTPAPNNAWMTGGTTNAPAGTVLNTPWGSSGY